jgi:hypothetical protein
MYNDQIALDSIHYWKDDTGVQLDCRQTASLQCLIIDLLEKKDLETIKAETRSEMWEEAHKYVSLLLHDME